MVKKVLLIALVGALATAAYADPAVRTIFLPRGAGAGATPMSVAYHPGFDRYYASNGGNPGYAAFVWDGAGNPIQTQEPINVDVRAWNYNANTAQLEIVAFNAVGGGTIGGLVAPGVDGSGNLTGGTTALLGAMPGLNGNQTMPAYDNARNRFYSINQSNVVNIASRVDGSLIGTINLDLGAAGNPNLIDYALGYDQSTEWLVSVSGMKAYAWDLSGSFVNEWDLDITAGTNYRMGYTNGQLFVFDGGRNGWQGYVIPEPASLALFGLAFLALRRR